MLILIQLIKKNKIIFDMRGFWHEEKVDRLGLSKKSIYYKFLNYLEFKGIQRSTKIICLTDEAIKILVTKYNVESSKFVKIPTAVNTQVFKKKNI